MRIAFLTRSLISCGAERQLAELAKGLYQRGHDVSVIVFYPQCQLAEELREMGIRVWILNKRGRWDIFHFIANFIKVLRIEDVDILHGYIGTPNIFAALVKPFFPTMKIIWGIRSANEVAPKGVVQTFLRITETCLSYCVDLIIVNSVAGITCLRQRHFPEKKLVMISNGIDSDRFCYEPGARQRIREEWGVGEKQILIGLIGRIKPEKGHKIFLKAAALLMKQHRDVRFVCVGDGDTQYQEELEELASFLDIQEQVAFVPARPDINCVYNALDILVSASYWEGFSNVIGEAMASGVPCVVTDVGDSARIVGNTGIVIPTDDPEALAKALKDMISLLAENKVQFAQGARQRIIEQFGTKHLVDTTLQKLQMLT